MKHPSAGATPSITTVSEYEGQAVVRIAATQLGTDYTAYQGKKVVDAWCEFFEAGPSPILDLGFRTRTPKRLFASLRSQTQLQKLGVMWGDYEDLSALSGMCDLHELWLGGASSVHSLEPLSGLTQLRSLGVESLRHAHDLGPLASLVELRDLEVGGDWASPRVAHFDSMSFLHNLTHLERLVLHTAIVDDLDYSPLLAHTNLKEARVMATRGMRPTHEELRAAIPVLGPGPGR